MTRSYQRCGTKIKEGSSIQTKGVLRVFFRYKHDSNVPPLRVISNIRNGLLSANEHIFSSIQGKQEFMDSK